MLQNLMRKMKRDNKGFTLVELMIVVVIIGILIAIAIPIYQNIQTNAERRACEANQRTIRSQMEVYRADASPTTTYDFGDAASFAAFLADDDYFAETPICPTADGTYTFNSGTNSVECADAISGH